MIYTLQPISGVDDDISNAVEWYENKQSGLGLKFIEDWENTVSFILSNPLAFSVKRKTFRQAVLKNFPYLIVYEIMNDLIVIYAVVSSKQHPKKRYNRKK